jgi:hypothetical protein
LSSPLDFLLQTPSSFCRLSVKRQVYFPVPAPSLFSSLAINGLPVSL